MIIALFVVLFISAALSFLAYSYLEKCRQLRSRLKSLGVPSSVFSGIRRGNNLVYLRDLIYEKETELAEQNFIATERF